MKNTKSEIKTIIKNMIKNYTINNECLMNLTQLIDLCDKLQTSWDQSFDQYTDDGLLHIIKVGKKFLVEYRSG